MRNTFTLMRLLGSQEVVLAQPTVIVCNIHKGHYNQSVNEHNLETWHKMHIPQTGANLSLLGHCHKFPEFSLTGKLELNFKVSADFQSGWEPCIEVGPLLYSFIIVKLVTSYNRPTCFSREYA